MMCVLIVVHMCVLCVVHMCVHVHVCEMTQSRMIEVYHSMRFSTKPGTDSVVQVDQKRCMDQILFYE